MFVLLSSIIAYLMTYNMSPKTYVLMQLNFKCDYVFVVKVII